MRIALAGAGAFGEKHLDGLKLIPGVEITSIISRTGEQAAAVAAKYGAKHSSTELEDALARDDVDAVILCTPTQMHAQQAIACMDAGKHVQVEIPLADSWADSLAVLAKAQGSADRVAAAGAVIGTIPQKPPCFRVQRERVSRGAEAETHRFR